MGKNKAKPEPPKRLTQREHIAAMTGTDPADWAELTRTHSRYAKGYRYVNRNTNQYARRVPPADTNENCPSSGVKASICLCAACNPNFAKELLED